MAVVGFCFRRPSRALSWLAALVSLTALQCSLTLDGLEGSGIGETCDADEDCHAGECADGLCTVDCANDSQCPAPSACFDGQCMVPLPVAALWEGVVGGEEGWNNLHQRAMQSASESLPYMAWSYEENVSSEVAGTIGDAVDRNIAAGARVIVANSFNQQFELLEKAKQYPDVSFLVSGGSAANGANLMSFYSYYDQTWFAAGKIAALAGKKRLGYIGALITPDQIRNANAFLLGARSVDPEVVLEIAWVGFWLDYQSLPSYEHDGELLFREELLAARLIDSGCEVIGHNSDNQRAVRFIEAKSQAGEAPGVLSIASQHRESCRALESDGHTGEPMASCLGSAFYNFSGQFAELLEDSYRGKLDASVVRYDPMTADQATTAIGFEVNPAAGVDIEAARGFIFDVVSAGPQAVFSGPYEIVGQRDADGDGVLDTQQRMEAGATVSDAEYARMCWFAEGVIEKADPLDPSSADVSAHVPDANYPPPSDVLGPPGAPPGVGVRCPDNI